MPAVTRVILAALLLATPTARAESPVQFVPPELDLGEWGAGGDATASAWLINTGDRPIELLHAEIDGDGLTLQPVERMTMPASGAVEFRVTLTADERVGATRSRRVRAFVAGAESPTLEVRVRSIHPDVHLPPPAVDRHAWSPVRPAPPRLDFEPAAPGERRTQPIWLINTADTPVRLIAAKGGCGCIEFPDFRPRSIGPGRAVALRPTMIGQGDIGTTRFKFTTFLFEGLEPVAVEFHMPIIDPRESKVRRFLTARDHGDTAAMRVCMTTDSRIWLGRRAGEGLIRRSDGTAPWCEWDAAMNTRHRYADFEVRDGAVIVMVTETSDFLRLAGCPSRTRRHTYFFDDDKLIEGLLIEPEPDDPRTTDDCLEAFLAWARVHDPRGLDGLIVDGRPARTAASADRWRAAMIEWRRASGRAPVDLGTPAWE